MLCKTCYYNIDNTLYKWCSYRKQVLDEERQKIGCEDWKDRRGTRVDHTTIAGKGE